MCTDKVSVRQNAIDTILVDGDLELCVTVQQSSLSSIDVFARCVAGGHHQILLTKLAVFVRELFSVIKERWPGCTATEVCLAPALAPHGISTLLCKQAVARGETSTTVGDVVVPLMELLGEESERDQDPALTAQVATLQLFRGLAKVLPDLAATVAVRSFLTALDTALDEELGGSYRDGVLWSPRLHEAAAVLEGVSLVHLEEQAVSDGRSRACALLGALGQLYEHSHLLLALEPLQLSTMSEVCAYLRSRVCGFTERACALIAKPEFSLRDVPALQSAFEDIDDGALAAVLAGGTFEPEPEPEPEPAAPALRPPEGTPPLKMSEVAEAIRAELGLQQQQEGAMTIKELICAAVSEAGFEPPQGTPREQLQTIAEGCGIATGW
jgi:hypothetical protein